MPHQLHIRQRITSREVQNSSFIDYSRYFISQSESDWSVVQRNSTITTVQGVRFTNNNCEQIFQSILLRLPRHT